MLFRSARPLRVEELAELLAFEFEDVQGGIPKHRAAWRLDNRMQAVLSTCSSLVTIIDEPWNGGQVVQFSHFSVKEFLISPRLASSLGDLSRYHIRLRSAHTILTQACLGSLLHLDDHVGEESAKSLPLINYAAQHWVHHAQFENVASHVKVGMETLFDPDKLHFANWIGIHDIDGPLWLYLTLTTERPTPLYYSALCGFYDLVKHLAIKHPQYVNAIGGRYHFPLLAALCEDHVEVAELLIELGANVDLRGRTGETILLKALSQPQHHIVDIVKFLLKHGSDVNARDGTLRSSLHLAESQGELEVAQMLVNHDADVNSRDSNGKTPFHILSESRTNKGDLNHALSLLKHGAEVNSRDKDNQTPIHLAIGRDRFKLAQLLLEHGADANAETNRGKTPLHILSERKINGEHDVDVLNHEHSMVITERNEHCITPSHPHSDFGPIQMAQALLEHGANVNAGNNEGKRSGEYHFQCDSLGIRRYLTVQLYLECGVGVHLQNDRLTPLHLASLYGRPDIARVLLDYGAMANLEDNFGRTPLHLVAEGWADGTYNSEQDCIRVAQLLLEHDADINAQDNDNTTPLHLACYNWRTAMVRVLLDGGAATNSKSKQGKTPLHSVAHGRYLYSDDLDGTSSAQLLLERGADVNAQDEDNRTPLHFASHHATGRIARVLLDGDATTNSKDNQGQTPLHEVAQGHSDALARLLLERGADVNAPDDDNETPLHLASYFGTVEMVLVLLNAGADACVKDVQGQTPLHKVSQSPQDSLGDGVGVAQLLLEHGADMNAQDNNNATPLDWASFTEKIEIASLLLYYGASG